MHDPNPPNLVLANAIMAGPPAFEGSKERKKTPRKPKRFIGVRQRPSGRWVAEIKDSSQKVRLWLGSFDTEEAAARAYDDAARRLRGANARTNFEVTAAAAASSSPMASEANLPPFSFEEEKEKLVGLLKAKLHEEKTFQSAGEEGERYYGWPRSSDGKRVRFLSNLEARLISSAMIESSRCNRTNNSVELPRRNQWERASFQNYTSWKIFPTIYNIARF